MHNPTSEKVLSPRNLPGSVTLTRRAALWFAPLLLLSTVAACPALAAEAGQGAAAQHKPKLYVLAVGAGSFQDSSVKPLPFAARDAGDIASAFKAQAKAGLYGGVEERTVVGKAATKQAVRDGLQWLRGVVGSGDVAVIYVSGHRMVDTELNTYVLPADVKSGSLRDLKATSLPLTDIQGAADALPGKTMLLLDIAHGSAVNDLEDSLASIADLLGKGKGKFGAPRVAARSFSRMAGFGKTTLAPGQVRTLYSASGKEVSALDPSKKNSAFAAAVLEAVTSKGNTTATTLMASDLIQFVSKRVAEMTDGKQQPQVEETSADPADFPFAVPAHWHKEETATTPRTSISRPGITPRRKP